MIIACAFKEVAILLFYDAGVQTTLGDYLVLDASSGVLPERIVIALLFGVLKAGFKTPDFGLGSERLCASFIEIIRVITTIHLSSSQIITDLCFLLCFAFDAGCANNY